MNGRGRFYMSLSAVISGYGEQERNVNGNLWILIACAEYILIPFNDSNNNNLVTVVLLHCLLLTASRSRDQIVVKSGR